MSTTPGKRRKKVESQLSDQAHGKQIDEQSLDKLIHLRHSNPHQVLGPTIDSNGVTIRAYCPGADQIEVVTVSKKKFVMQRIHDSGVFETVLPKAAKIPSYRFNIQSGGEVKKIRDPYSFPPTIGELDLHLFAEGKHEQVYKRLGAHVMKIGRVSGVAFSVWAPQAAGVSVVGDFNGWDGRFHAMRMLGNSGVWEIFVPDLAPGSLYKFEIRRRRGLPFLKADPYAQYTEQPPNTSSIVYQSNYSFNDSAWMTSRAIGEHFRKPMSIYEVHFGSWRRQLEEANRPFTYREMAYALADYAVEMGFSHIEFLPLKEHPYGPSWGYQVSYYYAPSARYGMPDDFRFLIDHLHQRGIGVIMDWVPAHFPKDAFALGRFDGSALYEHLDPRKGEHPDWGTYIFNYGRNEVRNFLIANALYWFKEFHIDGLRVDAVASMLYLDYSRKEGEWLPNKFGGRENLEAISFLKELNEITHRECPGTIMIAEESTSWPAVSHPVYSGGLGFDFKWNMGWMHDTLKYFQTDPLFRGGNHNALTFGLLYAWTENFILPFSHDEVVHMKGSLLNKMPGSNDQKFANLRALYAYMWAHPGKKLLFMGGEFGQWREWTETESLDWHLLKDSFHHGVQVLLRDLNKTYVVRPSLWEVDGEASGFAWLDVDNASENIVAFVRKSPSGKHLVCIGNFSALDKKGYRLLLPEAGEYQLVINSDNDIYGGGGQSVAQVIIAEPGDQGRSFATVDLPALTTLWFEAVE
ncbi:MAG TPA: 1,4-alpha-glucan branching protein GlgB [Pyrinomonadaceae bacterium]|nr:1,4-alpha-glucan branching protein GlgB [Pyrinomonadaceae bacterium]